MKSTILAMLCAVSALAGSVALAAKKESVAPESQPQAAQRAPTPEEIRARQRLGRVIVSPDGQFFLYEWMRPYNWLRDGGSLPTQVASRMQTWLYKVDVNRSPTTSQYVFFPGSGASYWLGGLSPDGTKVSFYALDDDNIVKAGVWNMKDEKLTWFETLPDTRRLDELALWVSNDEIAYPGASSALIRGNAVTGEAKACADCADLLAKARAAEVDQQKLAAANAKAASRQAKSNEGWASQRAESAPLDKDLKVLARSLNGELEVLAKDTPDTLNLLYRKASGTPEVVFENYRKTRVSEAK